MLELLSQPWAWYVAGPLIGLIVPLLLILGNKSFGISSSMRHICACLRACNVKFFKYDWKKEVWNLYFRSGDFSWCASRYTLFPEPLADFRSSVACRRTCPIRHHGLSNLVPKQLFSWENVLTLKGFLMMVVGGFLVGFGARYAGGCTSGHAIMGLSTLQLPSLIATISFMVGGFLMANLILPLILKL
jgi:uncharacterized membrane protein YedE/YeeE